jgi:hypothetical protein
VEIESTSRTSWAFPLALCLLGPFLFLSVIFSLLAPITTLYLHQGSNDRFRARLLSWVAIPVGALICLIVKGPDFAVGYILLAGIPGALLGELLDWRKRPEEAILLATSVCALLVVSIVVTGALAQHSDLISFLRGLTKNFLNQLVLQLEQLQKNQQNATPLPIDMAQLKSMVTNPDLFLQEAVGPVVSSLLLLHILPVILLVRWNPKNFCRRLGLSRDYLRSFSAPEWLVWPAIVCIALLIFEVPYLTLIAANLLKPLLIIYFFHGMSILAYFLDSFRLRGPLRYILYSVGLFFLTPMIVSCGFFDLWFDFRSRFETKA